MRSLSFLSTAILLLVSGCGDPASRTHPVRGVVRFPDGKLLRDGSVEFELIDRDPPVTATGMIGPDGRFVLGTFESDDGALAGKHRVAVIADYNIGTGAERPGMIPESEVHPRHRDFRTSGIILEVKPGTNNVVVEVNYADSEKTNNVGE